MFKAINAVFVSVLSVLLKAYQYGLRPYFGARCRFEPSCSDYTLQALAEHGAIKGAYLGTKRLCRCHPWNAGGYDPVPLKNLNTRPAS